MRKSRFTDTQIIAVIKEHDAGVATKELCRKHGISANTLYKVEGQVWRHGSQRRYENASAPRREPSAA
jgi:putative transposase